MSHTTHNFTMSTWMKLDGVDGALRVKVCVTDAGFTWTKYTNGVFTEHDLNKLQLLKPKVELRDDETILIIQYVKIIVPEENKILARRTELAFLGPTEDCERLCLQINTRLLSKELKRPKRLLIFINPNSGCHTAVRDYEAIVDPLLRHCDIDVNAVVTKSDTHAAEVLEGYDFASIDAVISMGGDGSLAQVTNGLIRRTMKDAQLDLDDPKVEPIKPPLTVGSIPAGSSNAFVTYANGTKDLETNVLSIALVVLPLCWFKWFSFDVEVDYLPVPEHEREFKLGPEFDAPLPSRIQITDGPWPGWKTLRCTTSELFVSPYSLCDFLYDGAKDEYHSRQLVTGKAILTVCPHTSLATIWAYEKLMRKGQKHMYRTDLEQIEVSALRVRGLQDWRDSSVGLLMHIDGDTIQLPDGPSYEAKVHSGLLTVFCLNARLVESARNQQPI